MKTTITAVILSGGQARRMGGEDKGLITFAAKPMVAHVIAVLESLHEHIDRVLLNTNRPEGYTQFGFQIIEDKLKDNEGPLVGIDAGLASIEKGYLLVVPCDTPLLTVEPILRLIKAVKEGKPSCVVVHDGEHMQTTLAMFHMSLKPALEAYLQRGGRRLTTWYKEQQAIEVDCSDLKDDFTNINTLDDLQRAELLNIARA
ncbi:MAG: molybdenum cofactor guanylyltransferase [Cycloclasticus sp.]|nr:MAG: molybdenum cofactor guanylyltransferase [Cycloclasticus sp.]